MFPVDLFKVSLSIDLHGKADLGKGCAPVGW